MNFAYTLGTLHCLFIVSIIWHSLFIKLRSTWSIPMINSESRDSVSSINACVDLNVNDSSCLKSFSCSAMASLSFKMSYSYWRFRVCITLHNKYPILGFFNYCNLIIWYKNCLSNLPFRLVRLFCRKKLPKYLLWKDLTNSFT